MCTAYGWVGSCSTHTAHNTLTALTSAHLWCVSTVETCLVCMSCAGKVHTPMHVCVVTTPHGCTSQHTPMCIHCTFMCTVCVVHIGACVVGNWTATRNETKIVTQYSVAHTGQGCLHTTLLCPCPKSPSQRPGPHGPLLTYHYKASLSRVDEKFHN